MPSIEVPKPPELIIFADERIVVNPAETLVFADNQPLELFDAQYHLLRLLGGSAGRVLQHSRLDTLLREVDISGSGSAVRTNLSRLRARLNEVDAKLGDNRTGAIRAVRGIGYRAVRSLTDR